ncbi:hypothetical protein QF030_000450 [Streptomyces rishiriensis]|uniref:Uncharacterized protein n=1 Tax=Streptomyces rishiriensis TaxID=68264 RepID=A0ABU0NGN3_STRRH|nr:hypothetical protein [Streptomyces rishiriensis]
MRQVTDATAVDDTVGNGPLAKDGSAKWLGSVVPGAFAGPWTPLPRHIPARIRFVVVPAVRAGKRRGRVSGAVLVGHLLMQGGGPALLGGGSQA